MTPWLVSSKELKIQRCFALTPEKKRSGVVTSKEDDNTQFREETFAIIQREHTDESCDYFDCFKKEALTKA